VENGHISLEFRDDGAAFDPTKQTGPDTELSIEERDIGGLGLHLVKSLMDKMEYEREGDYNVLKITKKID
jgi:serine/threonine-protein kinase RsbW